MSSECVRLDVNGQVEVEQCEWMDEVEREWSA